ncbi:hypothetical protein BCR33DRAFT_759288 [Rhizoclosmatium globosum]|uniref:Oxysterol-binding protein n=1 Tax=Rhizoclosmatium globosum TaxID=329046 RepID=A0A1Y2BD34_9FUNG|nr:hypothetical protein BCR33DRAFT_759288 [Rhizoclosmatium globosum]|eukprot:ORY32450.1 hypothetical protein BCR33DRAFT_759288 [Rhizoclosmatium globosum]
MDDNSSKLSFVWSLLKKLGSVKDLSGLRLSLPANLMEPRSNLEFWNYNDRPDYFASMGDPENDVERMLHVLRWFLCKDTKWKSRNPDLRKPYNPVLGEIFRCEWEVDNTPAPTFISESSSTPTSPSPKIRVGCLSEQIIHHPPISAFYYECKEKGVVARGVDHVAAKFTGTQLKFGAGEHNPGVFVNLEKWGEEYQMTYPWASVGGWLTGSPYITVSETTVVTCEKSGLRCIFLYKDEPFFGSAKFAVEGKVYRFDAATKSLTDISKIPESQVVATLSGQWNAKVFVKIVATNTEGLLFDLQSSTTAEKICPPEDLMDQFESRKLWKGVTDAIHKKEYGVATKLKREIEEEQRRIRKARKEPFESRFFTFKTPIIPDDDNVELNEELAKERGKPYLKEGVVIKLPTK